MNNLRRIYISVFLFVTYVDRSSKFNICEDKKLLNRILERACNWKKQIRLIVNKATKAEIKQMMFFVACNQSSE